MWLIIPFLTGETGEVIVQISRLSGNTVDDEEEKSREKNTRSHKKFRENREQMHCHGWMTQVWLLANSTSVQLPFRPIFSNMGNNREHFI